MREREEIIEEMSSARADLAENVEGLKEAVAEKLDVRAHAERVLGRARELLRARPRAAVLGALALGLWMGRE